MDQVSLMFRLFQLTGQKDSCPLRIHLDGVGESPGFGEPEDLLKHFHDVVVGVVLVVQ